MHQVEAMMSNDGHDAPRAAARASLPRATDVDRHVGARIRQRRTLLGITLQEMAERIGVVYQQAHKYERGVDRIAVGRLHRIAQALDVEVGYFFEDQENVAAFELTEQQSRLTEFARLFAALSNPSHQEILYNLTRALADADGSDKEPAES